MNTYHYAAVWYGPNGKQLWTYEVEGRDATEADATAKIELERALTKDGARTEDLWAFDLVYTTP